MSRRAKKGDDTSDVNKIRAELDELKASASVADNYHIADPAFVSSDFEKLSPVEQSAASLGVHPSEWKPIAFLNNQHYKQLIAANMLDDNLARRIEAFRTVASG
jgi:hypothetical protein